MELKVEFTRLQYNQMIMAILDIAIKKFPDQRFGQILRNLDIVKELRDESGIPTSWENSYNTESAEILNRISKCKELLAILAIELDDNFNLIFKA